MKNILSFINKVFLELLVVFIACLLFCYGVSIVFSYEISIIGLFCIITGLLLLYREIVG